MFLVAGILQAWVLFQDIGAEHRLWNGFIALLTIVAGVWLLTNRGQLHEDPVVFFTTDRNSQVVALLCGILVWAATGSWR